MLVSVNAAIFIIGGLLWSFCTVGYVSEFTCIVLGLIYSYDASLVNRKWNNKSEQQQQPTEVVAGNRLAAPTATNDADVKYPPSIFY